MRRCTIPPTNCGKPDNPCCADCGDKTCVLRCQNDPKRCGCWKEGPPPRKLKNRGRKVDSLRVAYLYAQGVSQKEIAWQLGYSRSTVCNILNELEVGRHGRS